MILVFASAIRILHCWVRLPGQKMNAYDKVEICWLGESCWLSERVESNLLMSELNCDFLLDEVGKT